MNRRESILKVAFQSSECTKPLSIPTAYFVSPSQGGSLFRRGFFMGFLPLPFDWWFKISRWYCIFSTLHLTSKSRKTSGQEQLCNVALRVFFVNTSLSLSSLLTSPQTPTLPCSQAQTCGYMTHSEHSENQKNRPLSHSPSWPKPNLFLKVLFIFLSFSPLSPPLPT